MSLKEKKITAEITICDYCGSEVSETGTHFEGATSGYMKRDRFEIDLCEMCAQKVGLKRRGRKPGTVNAAASNKPAEEAPKRKRGRPRKSEQQKTDGELVAVGAGQSDDSNWETS